jgi:3-deoxy-7-phosphoheptulonate synthase
MPTPAAARAAVRDRGVPADTAHPTEPAPVPAGGVTFGAGAFALIARVPAGSGAEGLLAAARIARAARAVVLDLGRAWISVGAELLAECGHASGLPLVCQVRDHREVAAARELADLLRAAAPGPGGGALLAALGRAGRPLLLEPAPAGGDGWLAAAERMAAAGNPHVVLCAPVGAGMSAPAGPPGRVGAAFDLAAVPAVRAAAGRPLLVDTAGHEAGTVAAIARGAAAVGADGVVVELAPRPAGGDAAAAGGSAPPGLGEAALTGLTRQLDAVAAAVGRPLGGRRIRYVGRTRP